MESFHLRPFVPQDGPAFGRLQLESPDTGRIHLTYHYQIDPYAALRARQGDFLGVVAEVSEHDGLAGACLVDFREAQIEGALRPCGLLNTLVVHPKFRRRGIATALVTQCVQAARERFGDEGLVWALIQRGNVGSVRTLTKHLRQTIPERIVSIPMKVRSSPSSPRRPRKPSGPPLPPAALDTCPSSVGGGGRTRLPLPRALHRVLVLQQSGFDRVGLLAPAAEAAATGCKARLRGLPAAEGRLCHS